MESIPITSQSIYIKHKKFLGLPIACKSDGTVVLDEMYTIPLQDQEDILDAVLRSDARNDKGIMFNIRNELFQIIKSLKPDVVLHRGHNTAMVLTIEEPDGTIVSMKNSTQFLAYIAHITCHHYERTEAY